MNEYLIIGGGLTGLSCATKLLQMEINPNNIEIYESKQEIGSPTRSPGIAIKNKNINLLLDLIPLQPLTLLNFEDKYITFRREWLEKSISIYLSKKGCKINLKSTITDKKLNEINISNPKIIINCAGRKNKSSGYPGDFNDFINSKEKIIDCEYSNLIPWSGYLSINKNPQKSSINSISINKKDNLNEYWTSEKNNLNLINENNIEIINSFFPKFSKNILANNTIDRGFLLAKKAVNYR